MPDPFPPTLRLFNTVEHYQPSN